MELSETNHPMRLFLYHPLPFDKLLVEQFGYTELKCLDFPNLLIYTLLVCDESVVRALGSSAQAHEFDRGRVGCFSLGGEK